MTTRSPGHIVRMTLVRLGTLLGLALGLLLMAAALLEPGHPFLGRLFTGVSGAALFSHLFLGTRRELRSWHHNRENRRPNPPTPTEEQ